MGKLVLFLADGTTLDIPLEQARLTVGRRASNDVCLPYAAVSGEHALFVIVPTGVVVEDLGSTNGTIVNGKRVARQFLHDRDTVEIGRQKFVYLTDATASIGTAHPAPKVERRRHGDRGGGGRDSEDSMASAPAPDPAREAMSPDALNDAAAAPPPASTGHTWSPEPERPRVDFVAMAASAGVAFAPGPDGPAQPATPPAATDAPPVGAHLRVVSGASAGRFVSLAKDEVLVGRVGVQVVAVRRVEDGTRLVLVEGEGPIVVNGVQAPADGLALRPGDAFDVAGARLEYLVPEVALPG